MNARRNARDYECLRQHSEAHLKGEEALPLVRDVRDPRQGELTGSLRRFGLGGAGRGKAVPCQCG
jgi:hypothetical protein